MDNENLKPIKHMKAKFKFDSNAFYNAGGSLIKMQRGHYEQFEDIFNKIEWVSDPDKIYNQVPLGMRGETDPHEGNNLPGNKGLGDNESYKMLDKKSIDEKDLPKDLVQLIKDVLMGEEYSQLQALFDFEIKFMDLWQGSEGCPWHWDGTDSADALLLAYFSDYKVWKPEFGGQLKIGKRIEVDTNNDDLLFGINSKVETLGLIPPQQRNMVLVNNQNPYFVHACNLLSPPELRRVTLTLGIDFICKENVENPSKVIWR